MAIDSIVVDNTVFNFFIKLNRIDLSHLLRSIISGRVLVPAEITREMQELGRHNAIHSQSIQKLQHQIIQSKFFIHCHSFDSIVLDFAQLHIDKGEAEAIAQCIKRRIRHFITDDLKCVPFITKHYRDIQVNSTFFLLALADLYGFIHDYNFVFYEYHRLLFYEKMGEEKKMRHQLRIQNEYFAAANILGIHINKRQLQHKTDVQFILSKFK